jgi:mono/diheme cytochrome c family protein
MLLVLSTNYIYLTTKPFVMKKMYLLALVLVSALAACKSPLYVPTEDNAKKANAPLSKLTEGRTVYTSKCGSCHKLYNPTEFNAKRWNRYVEKMAPKAKLTAEEKDKVLAYVLGNASN